MNTIPIKTQYPPAPSLTIIIPWKKTVSTFAEQKLEYSQRTI